MAPALTNLSMLLVACMLLCFQCLFTHTTAFFTSISSTGRGYLSRRHLKSGFSGGGIHASTVTPTKKPSAPGKIKVPKENPGELFKTSISIDEEFEEMLNNNNWNVILYNDPINKRAYVQGVLMDVFNWDENKANAVMMQAHTYGLAVLGEWYKELAVEYAEQLNQKNLIAEAKPAGGGSGDGNDGGEGGGGELQ